MRVEFETWSGSAESKMEFECRPAMLDSCGGQDRRGDTGARDRDHRANRRHRDCHRHESPHLRNLPSLQGELPAEPIPPPPSAICESSGFPCVTPPWLLEQVTPAVSISPA